MGVAVWGVQEGRAVGGREAGIQGNDCFGQHAEDKKTQGSTVTGGTYGSRQRQQTGATPGASDLYRDHRCKVTVWGVRRDGDAC